MTRRTLPLVAFIFSIAVAGLSAHLKVNRTFPESGGIVTTSPEQIRVWFSQSPAMPVSGLALEGPAGKIELGKVEAGKTDEKDDRSLVAPVVGKLVDGKYIASWKTAGNDGHILTGTFEFTVKLAERR